MLSQSEAECSNLEDGKAVAAVLDPLALKLNNLTDRNWTVLPGVSPLISERLFIYREIRASNFR